MNTVLAGLGEMPYRRVAQLLAKLMQQIEDQQESPAPSPHLAPVPSTNRLAE